MYKEFEKEELEIKLSLLDKIELYFRGIEIPYLDVTFAVDSVNLATDGIGAYEFWGARGVDVGTTYVEEFNISEIWVSSKKVSKRLEKKIIDALYEDEKLAEYIDREIMEELNTEPDCEDC